MKFFTKKTFLFKLIVSLCLLFVIFNFGMSTVSDAISYETKRNAAMIGGKLLEPVVDLLLAIGDAFLSVIQHAIMGTDSAVTIDTAKSIIAAIAAAVIAIVVVGFIVTSMGPLLAGIAALKLVAGAVAMAKITTGVATFYIAYTCISGAMLPEITLIPTYSISPEEIFRGEILLFDVNIFNPKEVKVAVYKPASSDTQISNASKDQTGNIVPDNAVCYWCEVRDDTGSLATKGTLTIINANLGNNKIEYTTTDGQTYTYPEGTERTEGTEETTIKKIKEFKFNNVTYIAKASNTGTRL